VLLEHIIGVTDGLASVDQGKSIQRAQIDKAAHQVARLTEIPVQLVAPGVDLLIQQGSQIFGAQVAQVYKARALRSWSGVEARSHFDGYCNTREGWGLGCGLACLFSNA